MVGNDGGSIAKRSDLVKTKQARATTSRTESLVQLFFFCALSKAPLVQPVVSCPLGKLYNKESVIAYLLAPPKPPTPPGGGTDATVAAAAADDASNPFGHDGISVAGHIRSLKDLTTLQLTPNPAFTPASALDEHALAGSLNAHPTAPFICPISMREMNGTVKFVYRKTGGGVVSESALKEMRRGVTLSPEDESLYTCPVTGEKYKEKEEWITINPMGEEAERMKEAWEAKKAREKEEKKAAKDKKRKNVAGGEVVEGEEGAPSKKAKKPKSVLPPVVPAPTTNGARLPATLVAELEAERKKNKVSAAVASLYAAKDDGTNKDKDGRSNWMTRGAFTRYA